MSSKPKSGYSYEEYIRTKQRLQELSGTPRRVQLCVEASQTMTHIECCLIDHPFFISMVSSCLRSAALTDGQASSCLGRLVAIVFVFVVVTTDAIPLCLNPRLGSRARTVAVIQRSSAHCHSALAIDQPRRRYRQRQCRIANPFVGDTRSRQRQCEQCRGR